MCSDGIINRTAFTGLVQAPGIVKSEYLCATCTRHSPNIGGVVTATTTKSGSQ